MPYLSLGSSGRRCALVASLVFLLGCEGASPAAQKPAQAAQAPAPPAQARVAPVRQGQLRLTRAYFAQVQPLELAQLGAGAPGEVVAVAARVGERVKRGDVLVEIDRDLANTQLMQITASRQSLVEQRQQLVRDAQRLESLGPELAPQAEPERLRAQARSLDAQLAQIDASIKGAREQLKRHRVLAPFDAVVASRQVNPGDWVNPGTFVMELVSDQGVEVLVNATPELLERVRPGDAAQLLSAGRQVPARVAGLVPTLSARTRTVTLRLLPEQPAAWLVPGQVVDAAFELVHEDAQALLVPLDAVLQSPAGARVLAVRDGKAVAVDLRVLEKNAREALVLVTGQGQSLTTQDQVIIRGNERIRPGQDVRVQTALDEAAAPASGPSSTTPGGSKP